MSKLGGEATETQSLLAAKKSLDNDAEIGDTNDEELSKARETVLDDVIDIVKLAFPFFISSLSWVGVSNLKAQRVGQTRDLIFC